MRARADAVCTFQNTQKGARSRVRSRRHASTASTRRPEAAGRPRSRLPRNTLSRRCRTPGRTRGSPFVGERSSPKICEDPRFDTLGVAPPARRRTRTDHRDYLSDRSQHHHRCGRRECGISRLPFSFSPSTKRAHSLLLSIKVRNKRTVRDRFFFLSFLFPFYFFFFSFYPCRTRHDHLRAFNRRKIEGG